MIRVLMADDHALVRIGLAGLLSAAPDVELVGTACDGLEAVTMATANAPDVILMDLTMPELDGFSATRRILAELPATRVIALTSSSDRKTILGAIDAGCVGYVLKDGEPDEVLRAVRAAASGGAPLDPRIATAVLTARAGRTEAEISDREREVLDLVATRLSNAQIAVRLGISEKTVKAHLTRIYQRLGIKTRDEAIDWIGRHPR
jgi:DNA-binding NarL/FixJ family response regulator